MKIISLLITLVLGFIYYYFVLPPINITSGAFYSFLGFLLIVFTISNNIESVVNYFKDGIVPKGIIKKNIAVVSLFIFTSVMIFLVNFVLSPLFVSKTYSQRIKVDDTHVFIEDVKEVEANKLPVIDKASSIRLGDRVMGQISDLVSQFTVSDLYTQINFQNEIIRVTPLEYSDIFKLLANYEKGIEGYITVNSVTGVANLVRLDDGLKYMDSAILGKDLNRKLRFSYPTKIFGEKSFELDDDKNPYWVIPTIKHLGVDNLKDVEGVVILNPITGESNYYDVKDVPSWVDHVYPARLILEQVNHWGTYKNGFLNSLFGQKEVVVTTQGYNYTILNDDVYLYTGITSVLADESNIGFIMTNLRTKETMFYQVPGAEEFSAMSSAKGQVQEKNFTPTFPLLVNINNKPTYFISLKDNAGLVKMYAFVDVEDYQRVVVTDSSKGIETAIKNYIGNDPINTNKELIYKDITISSITSAIIDSNTYYYIKDTNNKTYKVSLKVKEDLLPFLNNEDQINIGYSKEEFLTIILEIK
jgi:hypothetical protein